MIELDGGRPNAKMKLIITADNRKEYTIKKSNEEGDKVIRQKFGKEMYVPVESELLPFTHKF